MWSICRLVSDPTLKESGTKHILLSQARELDTESLRLVAVFCDVNVNWIGHCPESYPGDSLSDCSQIVLRNCFKEVSIHVILVKGECMQSSTYF